MAERKGPFDGLRRSPLSLVVLPLVAETPSKQQ